MCLRIILILRIHSASRNNRGHSLRLATILAVHVTDALNALGLIARPPYSFASWALEFLFAYLNSQYVCPAYL